MSTILAATDLVVRYNERAILDAATLGIDEGDRIGLVGRNGSGKTTFLKILAGLLAPDSGVVTARRELVVSYLSQDFTLEAGLDVRGNVRSGARRTLDLIAEFESLPAQSKRHEELERRIQAFVGAQPGGVTSKREIYKRLWRHYSDAEVFNRSLDSLVRAGELFTKSAGRGSIWISLGPLE